MTQEEKELLLKDLCARLPYKIRVSTPDKPICAINSIPNINSTIVIDGLGERVYPIKDIKPYLFPISSMAGEQNDSWRDAWFPDLMTSTDVNYPESEKYLAVSHAKSLDWLYKNHIDIYGFIEKGLAIDATGLNIY